jgi:hypothetical protein
MNPNPYCYYLSRSQKTALSIKLGSDNPAERGEDILAPFFILIMTVFSHVYLHCWVFKKPSKEREELFNSYIFIFIMV